MIISFISNVVGIIIASLILPGVNIVFDIKTIALVALLLTLGHYIARPILKLIFGPLVFITLGLFIIIINAIILYAIDTLINSITINGLGNLLYMTLILSSINVIMEFFLKRKDAVKK